MKGLGYVFLVFLGLGCWIVWQIVRRASAGAQAVINPERYAIEKVEEMQQDILVGEMLLARERESADTTSGSMNRWDALVKYDEEVAAAAEQLRGYGEAWIDELRRAYFALNEDKGYLSNIVKRLREDAELAAKAEVRRRADEEERRRQTDAEAQRHAEQERRRREAELRRQAGAQAEAMRKAAEARAEAERQTEGRRKAEFVILVVCGIVVVVTILLSLLATNGG